MEQNKDIKNTNIITISNGFIDSISSEIINTISKQYEKIQKYHPNDTYYKQPIYVIYRSKLIEMISKGNILKKYMYFHAFDKDVLVTIDFKRKYITDKVESEIEEGKKIIQMEIIGMISNYNPLECNIYLLSFGGLDAFFSPLSHNDEDNDEGDIIEQAPKIEKDIFDMYNEKENKKHVAFLFLEDKESINKCADIILKLLIN